MANFFTDFGEYPIGSAPADWTERWNTADASYSIVAGGDCNSKILAVDVTASGYPAFSWDDVDSLTDVELLVRFRRKGTNTSNEKNIFVVRGAGTSSFHGYFVEFQTTGGQATLKLARCVTGSYAQIGSTVNIATYAGANNWNYVRFQCRGTALKAKLWDASTSEPGAWQIERTDSNVTTAGWSGVGHGNQTTYDYDVDYFALGSGTDSPVIPVYVTADHLPVVSSILGNWGAGVLVNAGPILVASSILGGWDSGVFVAADPLPVTTSILGNLSISVSVVADPLVVTLSQRGLRSQWPARLRDPALDLTFDCRGQDRFGNRDKGVPVFTTEIIGSWFNWTCLADPLEVTLSQEGGFVGGLVLTADPLPIVIGFKDADVLTELLKTNWVKWSDIGSLDFTIGKDNVAGERPLAWKGWVYDIRKLGGKVIVYGENGVSALIPSEKYYGLQTIYRIGLKGKSAVTGDNAIHFFVDNLGQLWRFIETMEKLDYSEYLSGMNDNLVLSWDMANQLLYICDGIQGYVFSQDSQSLGAGPVNITGINSQDGLLCVVSPAAIETPVFEMCTDIYDLGTRKGKSIQSIEIGTDLTETLEAAIDYRVDKADVFARTDWHVVDPRGLAYIPCYGREFRFRVRCSALEYFEIDAITVNGEVCKN